VSKEKVVNVLNYDRKQHARNHDHCQLIEDVFHRVLVLVFELLSLRLLILNLLLRNLDSFRELLKNDTVQLETGDQGQKDQVAFPLGLLSPMIIIFIMSHHSPVKAEEKHVEDV
jgi:hypothetical protein